MNLWSVMMNTLTLLLASTPSPAPAATSEAMPLIQYLVQVIVGLGAAAIGAGAVTWNARRQRAHERTLDAHRLEESRKGMRRELEARLREFARHIASFRANGFGEMFVTIETHNRLKELMTAASGGPASLPSDDSAKTIYDMLDLARVNLKTLADLSESDSQRAVPPSEFADWTERCQIMYSNIVKGTCDMLTRVFNDFGDNESVELLGDAETRFAERMKAYAARLDAERAAVARRLSQTSGGKDPQVTARREDFAHGK